MIINLRKIIMSRMKNIKINRRRKKTIIRNTLCNNKRIMLSNKNHK